jgi:creatinine deaminase
VNRGKPDAAAMLRIALEEALAGLEEDGIPVGAALFDGQGRLLGRGRNRRVQDGDPSVHGETDAFRRAGRQKTYRDKVLATTLAPCWYCSGLVRQFGIGRIVVGDSVNFSGGLDWLREAGVEIVDLASKDCIAMMRDFISARPDLWREDIGDV